MDVVREPRMRLDAEILLETSESKCCHDKDAHLPENDLLISHMPQLLPLLSNGAPFSIKNLGVPTVLTFVFPADFLSTRILMVPAFPLYSSSACFGYLERLKREGFR